MCKTKPENHINIDITITELVLTPVTCAVLINEIIKYLIYQKSQIPYPYNWLQTVINRKPNSGSTESIAASKSLTVKQHHRTVTSAYNILEDIMRNIKNEFANLENGIQEVSLLFGATPYTVKEAFIIKVPRVATGHNELNHSHLTRKNQHKILRNIFLCEEWISAMKHTIPSTNLYVLLRKQGIPCDRNEDNFFLPVKHFVLPAKVRSTIINLQYDLSRAYSCCGYLSVFEDSAQDHSASEKSLLNSSEEMSGKSQELAGSWYQAKLLFKGYKDCFVNNTSAVELF